MGILLIPFISQKLNEDVQWSLMDFVFVGILLSSIAICYEWIRYKQPSKYYRFAIWTILITILMVVWINGAVGIVGHEGQSINLLYYISPLLGIIGSLIFNFKASAMSRIFFTVSVVQLLVPMIGWIIWPPSVISWSPGMLQVVLFNTILSILYAMGAWLFKISYQKPNSSIEGLTYM